jgi:penicillin V acylase-like amidase (Ntn superfamily)
MSIRAFRCRFAAVVAIAALAVTVLLPASDACTRILWNDNKLAVLVGRTMDGPKSTEANLTLLPRGLERNGGLIGAHPIVTENPAKRTARYGSLVVPVYGMGTADGLNEKGLAGTCFT